MRRQNAHFGLIVIASIAFGAGAACGDDGGASNEPVTPPETPDRSLPVTGAPETDDWEAPPPEDPFVPEDRVTEGSEQECCTVVFAYQPEFPEQVQSAVLRGNVFPLDVHEGVVLAEADGVWSGEACLAPDVYATYYYDVALETPSGGVFPAVEHNPVAPTAEWRGEIVNAWLPGDDCASIDVAVHAETAE
jgi:hypothetical protein